MSPISSSNSPLRIAFSTRIGGTSQGVYGNDGSGLNLATHVGDEPEVVRQNRLIARDLFDLPHVVYMDQVHGSKVAIITRSNKDETPTVDAIVTKERGVALAVLVADCVPLLMHDLEIGVIAAVHVGRRGLGNGVVANAVEAMKSIGAVSIRANMGPAICGDCYEVPVDMQSEISSAAPAARSVTDAGSTGLDIRDGVAWQLEQMDIESIIDPMCTRQSQLHYSFRRDGLTGRTAGFIYLV